LRVKRLELKCGDEIALQVESFNPENQGYIYNRPLSKVNFYPIKSMGQIPVLKEV